MIIIGAGLTGLALANAMCDQGIAVTLIDRQEPGAWDASQYGLRVSAISLASKALFESLNVWGNIQSKRVSPYQHMQVWDAVTNAQIQFDAAEIAERYLGNIIENDVMIEALWEKAKGRCEFITGQCESLEKRQDGWQLQINDHTLKTELVVGCDGARSWVREQAGINADRIHYGQKAIVGVVKTEKPHELTAYQRFLPSGPLAFLPLDDPNHCSIVWSLDDDLADDVLSASDFNERLEQAFDHRLGKLELQGKAGAFPLIHHHADQYVLDGLVLVGDSAHAIHPLAGQGVNLGFADVACLAEIIAAAREKGRRYFVESTLQKYERARRAENSIMHQSMTGFNALFSNEKPTLVGLRSAGLSIVDQQTWLKRFFVKRAMG